MFEIILKKYFGRHPPEIISLRWEGLQYSADQYSTLHTNIHTHQLLDTIDRFSYGSTMALLWPICPICDMHYRVEVVEVVGACIHIHLSSAPSDESSSACYHLPKQRNAAVNFTLGPSRYIIHYIYSAECREITENVMKSLWTGNIWQQLLHRLWSARQILGWGDSRHLQKCGCQHLTVVLPAHWKGFERVW